MGRLTAAALIGLSLLVGCGQFGASGWQACTWVYARDTGHRLFDVFSLDGGEEHRLTEGKRSDSPSLSPDGKRIVFTRGIGLSDECCGFPHTELYVMDADGDNQRRLLDGEGDDDSPVWSPDGSMIAFVRKLPSRQAVDTDSKQLLMVVPVSGERVGKPRVVAEVTTYDVPAWSPDSTRLAWLEHPPRPSVPPDGNHSHRPPLRPSVRPSDPPDRPNPSSMPSGIHLVSPAPRPEVSFDAPHVEVRPPRGTRTPSRRTPPRATVRWKAVTGPESGKFTAPEDANSAPVWIDSGHMVFSISPIGPSPIPDLARIRIADGTVALLRVPVVLPARMSNGRIAGMVQGDKAEDSELVVVDQGGGGHQTVAKLRMKFPYRGMTISAVCPD